MFTEKTSLIVPTKDRTKKVINLLNQITEKNIFFSEIIIVDSSNEKNKKELIDFISGKKIKLISSKPSISLQRNLGLKNSNLLNEFIMFCDDDIVFKNQAFQEMDKGINKYIDVAAFSFNLDSPIKDNFLEKIKRSYIVNKIGIYSDQPGKVLRNGWQTKFINVDKDLEVQWLSTQAVIYRRKKIDTLKFDENLGQYSYLEDFDFSFMLSKKSKLMVISLAKYNHPNFIERKDFNFGKLEIINRYYLVKKHNFNKFNFFFSAIIKIIINFFEIFRGKFLFNKILGNICALYICLRKK